MNNKSKITSATLIAALAVSIGSTFVFGQLPPSSIAPSAVTPSTGTTSPTTTGNTTMHGNGPREGRGGLSAGERRQPHMAEALVRLREARRQLDDAAHDKGGFREIAIQHIDQSIADVEAGIKYAEDHGEEYPNIGGRGGRGLRRGGPPPTTTTPGNTTTPVSTPAQ